MRLLQRDEMGKISLTKNFVSDNQIPPYAILSHVWGLDTEEVTFEDLTNNTGHNKVGYEKIWLCGEQAARDGLKHFWVDTCCIDKSSSSELSESINSMYKWYKRSKVCYVYLSDVTALDNPPWKLPADEHLEENERASLDTSEFARSRWFTRGWTLQELLAPEEIHFYSRNWIHLGNLEDLLSAVAYITKIDHRALSKTYRNSSFGYICIGRRMSWAANRQTTRPEDRAYCLMGIFNVHMPLLYGEGEHAFVRLQEEILKNTDDDSILAWNFPSYIDLETPLPSDLVLAPSPDYFESCAKLVRRSWGQNMQPWSMSNIGLTITMESVYLETSGLAPARSNYVILDCRNQEDPDQRLAIFGHGDLDTDIKHLYPNDTTSRIAKLSQRQLDSDDVPQDSVTLLLMRQLDIDPEFRMFDEPVTMVLDSSLNTGVRARHVVSIESYYPSSAWDAQSKRLTVTRGSIVESLVAVRLTYHGDNLLLVLKQLCRSFILDEEGINRPILIRCPRRITSIRSLVSRLPEFLESEHHVYHGPLHFRYMQRKYRGRESEDLVLKAYLNTRRTQEATGLSNGSLQTANTSRAKHEITFNGELYKPLTHQYWRGTEPCFERTPSPDP